MNKQLHPRYPLNGTVNPNNEDNMKTKFSCLAVGDWSLDCKDCRREAMDEIKQIKGRARSTMVKTALSLAMEAIKEYGQ